MKKSYTLVLALILGLVLAAGHSMAAGPGAKPNSRGFTLDSKKAPQAKDDLIPGENRALLIGNNEYRSAKWPKLKTAVKDVEGFSQVLIKRYGYKPDNIRLIKNGTRREIMRGFLNLAGDAKPNDTVVIYYAGHGEYDKNERGWWIPVDGEDSSNYIANEEVLANIRSIKAKHKLLISDSCFSGNLLTRSAKDTSGPGAPNTGYYREKSRLASVQGLSSGGNEPVSDGGAEWGGHSIFAYHLLGVLKANQKRYLSASLLGYRLAETVANDTATAMGVGQTPILNSIKNQGDQGGEFFFEPDDLGPLVAIPVALFYVKSAADNADQNLTLARENISQGMAKLMDNHNMQIKGVKMVDMSSLEKEMLETVKSTNSKGAILINLDAEAKKEQTLMWQGKTTMKADVAAYKYKNGTLKKITTVEVSSQTLPMRRWDNSPEKLSEQYQKNAEKVVSKWNRAELGQMLNEFETD
ncbi:MAG: caspase family protein [Deltaproteobacteria bacterium]|nr:caspase family protein [Deltaproteobacteria bacterium]